jgi:PTH1 family peptidyl-tRNA hydrolase
MLLVVGLGNPGEEYAATPHNLGFLVVDALAARHSIRVTRKECQALVGQGLIGAQGTIGDKPVILAKPQTYMNLSGVAVKSLVQKFEIPISDLLLVYDELDLPWGGMRIRPGGSAAGHNGAKDVIAKLGTQQIARLRLGVHPGHPLSSGADYLLSRFTRQQNETLDSFIGTAADAVESIIAEGVEKSMARFNSLNGRAQGSTEEER